MEPNRGEGPGFEVPQQPSPEVDEQQEQTVEAPVSKPETSGSQSKAPALPAIPDDIPVSDQPVIAAPAQDLSPPIPTDPKSVASDTDHIEREWVDKVKTIITKTQDDPHLQKEQMSRIKAEYIQKRFNKTIKTDEAAA